MTTSLVLGDLIVWLKFKNASVINGFVAVEAVPLAVLIYS
jgi:hypothetical protein